MNSTWAASPWRALALLAVLVLAGHALVLCSTPARFGPALKPASPPTRAFVTRSIESPPPPAAVTAVEKPVAEAVKKPVFKQKEPVAQEERTPEATDLIASSAPEPAASAPETPAAAASAPPEMTPPAAAASAPSSPASPAQTPVTAMALPASAQLAYKMTGSAKGLNYHANAELNWQNAGDTYTAQMRVSALFLGSRSMSSSGQVGPEGLAPSRFTDKSRSEVAAHFEPDKGLITFSANTPAAPWVKGAQDRVSVLLQLGGMLAGSPASFPVGSSISLYTAGPRDADTWTFLVEAEEKINLPYGELATLKLTSQPRREFEQKVEVWYAPALGYLPVRNRITRSNGDSVDQQLTDVMKP